MIAKTKLGAKAKRLHELNRIFDEAVSERSESIYKRQIAKVDKEIEEIVCGLYGISEAEYNLMQVPDLNLQGSTVSEPKMNLSLTLAL